MSYTCIETTSSERMAAYKETDEYAQYARHATAISEGTTPKGDIDESGNPVDVYWLFIENDAPEDNVTLRINDQGKAEFWATGVEA